MPVVKERPILFSEPMVRAILAGRKTQTRRVIKPDWWRCLDPEDAADRASAISSCPYGQIGDHLWVKEGVRQLGHERTGKNGQYKWPRLGDAAGRRWFDRHCYYTADGGHDAEPQGTLNKLFMPRWASRLTLEVTGIRIERLQDLDEHDAESEGIYPLFGRSADQRPSHVLGFRKLWEVINAGRPGCSWTDNPWVWVIEFRRRNGGD